MSTRTLSDTDTDNEPNVNLFVGLPGAGKTAATETAEDVLDGVTSHEVSDYVRYAYEAETGGEAGDNELGRWAAEKKDENGNGHFVRELAVSLHGPVPASRNINIAGVRSPEEADAVRDVFGPSNVTIITIWTLPDLRFERLQSREGEYTVEEFEERRERELWDWGCIEFFTDPEYYDYIVPNNSELAVFERDIEHVLYAEEYDFHTAAFQASPFPEGLSQEHVASYL